MRANVKLRRIVFMPCFAVAVFLAISAGASHAGEVRFGNALPGGAVIQKEVKSTRELKYTDMIPQRTDFSCGAASVATILKYAYGVQTTEEEVLEGMFEVADQKIVLEKGFSLLDMKRYVEKIGMQGIGFRIKPEEMETIAIPTIVLVNIKGYYHFVVLKKVQDGKVYVGDPALGNQVYELDKFVDTWNGIVFAVIANNYQEANVLVQAQDPISARKLLDIRAPVTRAQLYDFGFRHADQFQF